MPLQAADYRAWWVRRWAVEFGDDAGRLGTYPENFKRSDAPKVSFRANLSDLEKNIPRLLKSDLEASEFSALGYWDRQNRTDLDKDRYRIFLDLD